MDSNVVPCIERQYAQDETSEPEISPLLDAGERTATTMPKLRSGLGLAAERPSKNSFCAKVSAAGAHLDSSVRVGNGFW